MATIFFFDDTNPVGKCDIYRQKDKVLTTCVDTMPADIPHDTYTFVILHIYPRNKIVAMTYASTHVYAQATTRIAVSCAVFSAMTQLGHFFKKARICLHA